MNFGDQAANASQVAPQEDIEIVLIPQRFAMAETDRYLTTPFGTHYLCQRGSPPLTLREALGPQTKRILVHHLAQLDFELVKDYIQRLLEAVPEGGRFGQVDWSEIVRVGIIASVEYTDGDLRRLELSNGYVHLEDLKGCQWWARYLGGDRSTRVVLKNRDQ